MMDLGRPLPLQSMYRGGQSFILNLNREIDINVELVDIRRFWSFMSTVSWVLESRFFYGYSNE